ncbi:hypothetical protein BISA_1620 [Bifidobacterium saguini DSM 23967]|uniref:Uncharacterized protein n=1 Tax=Bifidobacterium saguini DSM 23967 TaxID=1437607 RepID=A0A087DE48_9BIFI|nr:hypothetical protein BISA_1620 [Bifidobacterium saguini DSM 23967]
MISTIHIPNTGHPWSTVYAVAAANIPESWLLTGGLMVQLHAIMGGLTARPTTDATCSPTSWRTDAASPDYAASLPPAGSRCSQAR